MKTLLSHLITPFLGLFAISTLMLWLLLVALLESWHRFRAGRAYEGGDGPGRPQDYINPA